jgi:hypothetical protein
VACTQGRRPVSFVIVYILLWGGGRKTRIKQTNKKIPASTVDLDELIDDLAHPKSEGSEPLIIGAPEFLQPVISYETPQQHLTQLIRYFIMLLVH